MKNIVLIGFMGTGKTEVSKILAERLKRQRLCLDDMIEWKTGKFISDIFAEDGEQYFRKVESEMVASASKDKDVIIDAGGGAIVDETNHKRLKEHGVIFCLTATPEVILERTKSYAHRPLLDIENPKVRIVELLNKRAKYYARADYTIDTTTKTSEQTAEEIIKIMESLEREGSPKYAFFA